MGVSLITLDMDHHNFVQGTFPSASFFTKRPYFFTEKKKKGDLNFVTFFHPSKSLPRSSVICLPFIK